VDASIPTVFLRGRSETQVNQQDKSNEQGWKDMNQIAYNVRQRNGGAP
jgi:hypothetical protein